MTIRIVSAIYNDFAHLADFYKNSDVKVTSNSTELTTSDILLLHGGSDISPSYYDEKPSRHMDSSLINPSQRDKIEWALLQRAMELGIPIFGICRGAQFLSIAAGGKLFQHVVGHESGRHVLRILPETKEDKDKMIWSNSCHHQQMDVRKIPETDYKILATHPNKDTDRYEGENAMRCWNKFEDPEIVYFKKIKGFAVQGHPEWMSYDSNFVQYCLTKSQELWGVDSTDKKDPDVSSQ